MRDLASGALPHVAAWIQSHVFGVARAQYDAQGSAQLVGLLIAMRDPQTRALVERPLVLGVPTPVVVEGIPKAGVLDKVHVDVLRRLASETEAAAVIIVRTVDDASVLVHLEHKDGDRAWRAAPIPGRKLGDFVECDAVDRGTFDRLLPQKWMS